MAEAFYSVVLDHPADAVWAVSFDCAAEERERWLEQFEQKGFEVWLAALRRFMDDRANQPKACG